MDEALHMQLIEKAKRREQNAMYQLFTDTRDSAYYAAKCYLKDDKNLAGLLKDCYIAAFGNLEDITPGMEFSKWLQIVVATKCASVLRSRKVKFEVKNPVMALPSNGDLFPQEWAQDEARKLEIINVVDVLPEPQRMALVMHYYCGMTLSETGRCMGIDELNANSHLHTAKETLRSGTPETTSSKPAMTQLLEAAAEPMPADMAKTIYQEMTLFFMSGGKAPKLTGGSSKSKPGDGGRKRTFLPYLILFLAVILSVVFLFFKFQQTQKKVGAELVAEYENSKAAVEAEERAYQEEAQQANPPGEGEADEAGQIVENQEGAVAIPDEEPQDVDLQDT